MSQIESHIDSM